MSSLYNALVAQHARQLRPVCCAYSTITQLHRYFEDVVLENNLNALVIEGLPLSARRNMREKARVRQLAQPGRRAFFFVRLGDALNDLGGHEGGGAPLILRQAEDNRANEHFLVIAGASFYYVLASLRDTTGNACGV